MKLSLTLAGRLRRSERDIALEPALALLDAVARERSVQAAARGLGVSYRSAWGRIAALEATLGRPVAIKTKGHGSALTPFGEDLRAALAEAFGACAPVLAASEARLAARLAALLTPEAARLRVAVSHDTLLSAALAGRPEFDVTIAGSAEALSRLAAGSVDAAGFHFGAHRPEPGSPFAAVFEDPGLAVRPLFLREQGLLGAAGNPLGLAGIADIVRTGARFVNRQRGAGTRLWFERLCAEAGIRPEAIRGAETEEFTHQAVAATIASGAADVGMGTRAVAARFGLAFLPVGRETYYLAARLGADARALALLVARVGAELPGTPGYAPVA
ncbi:substrate-binding domain-containing protein [Methylobacterium planeticum]|uniref:Helix-turn-helix transcriptional regulator n=1 Tax=Methylobacterium planeticum TaxID=2615211 RepID=A0A6N6MIE6_9HYPH|nr:substrate-binding domain-containing protein [Methylobacterium planeticum]KAB1070835.1 helix-turn-helix transcriptional regulator [Methylobacterium planeticum]